ncbi:MAG: hypothetical protein ACLQPH_07480 [Acidimicrobiales bacterium]
MNNGLVRNLAAVVLAGLFAGACGSGSATSSGTHVQPPDWPLQGCTYTVNGTVPSGEPQGIQPGYPSFSPDASAGSALQSIKDHGGEGMFDGVVLAAGTPLRAGPDTSGSPVATVGSGTNILAAEPVVWTDGSGGQWLAFFLACGGDNLYWVNVVEADQQIPGVSSQIATDRKAPTTLSSSGIPEVPSFQPVVIDRQHLLTWKDSRIQAYVGRGLVFTAA